MSEDSTGRLVAVLDRQVSEDRPLRAYVEDIGAPVRCFDSVDELVNFGGDVIIFLSAFEELWPGPQEQLKRVRRAFPNVRIVVVLSPDSPRLRLAKRLWESGGFDYTIHRTPDAVEFDPVLRQALADSVSWGQPAQPEETENSARIRQLTAFSTALANHDRIDDILKVLHHRMSSLVPFRALALLIALERPMIYLFQRGKVTHTEISELYNKVCQTANQAESDTRFTAGTVQIVDGAAPLPGDTGVDAADPMLCAIPLSGGGAIVGCLGILSDSQALGNDAMASLELTAHHLASALRFAMTLEKMRRENTTDPLTGLSNRRHLAETLHEQFQRASRYKLKLCMMMIDIDHFKRVNDLYGHQAGDAVIRSVAALLRSVVRLNDFVFRYGGEEFLLVLPETDLIGSVTLFERIRLSLSTGSILPDSSLEHLRVTVSGGLACFEGQEASTSTPMEFVEIADMALLQAKRAGRDQLLIGASGKEPAPLRPMIEDNQRLHHRIEQSVVGEFMPLQDVLEEQAISIVTRDLSAGGVAVIDSKNQLQRNRRGLLFLGESRSPLFCRVNWARSHEGQTLAGLEFLNPRTALASPMEAHRCLVLVSSEGIKKQVSRVVLASGMKVDSVSSEEELRTLDVGQYRIIIIDEQSLDSAVGRYLLALRETSINALELVVLSAKSKSFEGISLLEDIQADHLLGIGSWQTRSLFAAINKITAGRRFGVRHYLLPMASVSRWQVSSNADKRMALEGVRVMAEEVEGNRMIIEHAIAALDEMILNAMRVSASDGGSRPVMVEAGYDTEMLAIGVLDELGDLNRQAVFESLARAVRSQKAGIAVGADSASLGFRIMLDSLNHVIVNVEPGKCTEVVGLVTLHNSLREFRESKIGLSLID